MLKLSAVKNIREKANLVYFTCRTINRVEAAQENVFSVADVLQIEVKRLA